MRFLVRYSPCLLIGLLVLGCGKSSFIKAKGRIVKGGQPYLTQEGEGLRIFFSPLEAPTGQQYDSFAAIYEPDNGSFQVVGKDGQGLPPGKYRVGLQLMKSKEDLLGGKLLGKKSPFVTEVISSQDDIVIELDTAKFDSLLAGEKPAKAKTKKG